jgi:hypothetical protein
MPEQQNLCSIIPWGERKCSEGAERLSPFLHHGLVANVMSGGTPLHFCEKVMKTGAQVYQEEVLQGVVKPLNITLFNGQG